MQGQGRGRGAEDGGKGGETERKPQAGPMLSEEPIVGLNLKTPRP